MLTRSITKQRLLAVLMRTLAFVSNSERPLLLPQIKLLLLSVSSLADVDANDVDVNDGEKILHR